MTIEDKFVKLLEEMIHDSFSVVSKKDSKGILSSWGILKDPCDIEKVALTIKEIDGRLMTITAYTVKDNLKDIVYHFDLDGHTFNITTQIKDGEITSITPILKAADWTERELKELYDIKITGHPNPSRLFLDETIEEGVMNQLMPLSEAMSGASSQTLWEKVMSSNQKEEN
ncbi:MAG: NADH-quinone oxidoreductase subunit C [Sulfurimonas sp.]|jgi:NADH-quinone oxidoreductase subunit C